MIEIEIEHWITSITFCGIQSIQNPVKRLKWSFLQK